MNRPKVFVVSNTGHDFSSAEQRGDVVYMFDGKINVFASDQLCKDISTMLRDSSPDDYVIPSGNALAACVAFSTMMEKHGKVNTLIFSFKNSEYEVRTIRRNQLTVAEEVQ